MEVLKKQDFKRVFDIVDYQQNRYAKKKSLNVFENDRWSATSTKILQSQIAALACHLLDIGLVKGDKVILMPRMGSPDWMKIDFACQQLGLIVVPVGATNNEEEICLICKEMKPKLCVVQDTGLYYLLSTILKVDHPDLPLFHLDQGSPGYFSLLTKKQIKDFIPKVFEIKKRIDPEDVFSILYTSGTSGLPKGVMLTHVNVVSNIKSILPLLPFDPIYRALSFLPFSHIFERNACYTYMAAGVDIYFGTHRDNLAQDFKTVRPHFCTSVPRIIEKMYDLLQEYRLGKGWLQRKLIGQAFRIAEQYMDRAGMVYRIQLFLMRLLVLRRIKSRLGGNIRMIMVGSAALRPELGRLFTAAKIQILEGYGMTETSPVISITRSQPGLHRFGTVGIPIPGVEVIIDPLSADGEGEILVRGPNVMKGYFQRPKLMKEIFTNDGWMRTGDVGMFVEKIFLKITDRRKDIFKTSAGKYIAPKPLESCFEASPFIQQCMVIGFQRPYITALLVPHFKILESWCKREGIHWTAPTFMVHNIKVLDRLQQEVDHINDDLPNFKRIRKFLLMDHEWNEERGEMGHTYKKIRAKIVEPLKRDIEKMYC